MSDRTTVVFDWDVVFHHLKVLRVGDLGPPGFLRKVLGVLGKPSNGIPRKINNDNFTPQKLSQQSRMSVELWLHSSQQCLQQ